MNTQKSPNPILPSQSQASLICCFKSNLICGEYFFPNTITVILHFSSIHGSCLSLTVSLWLLFGAVVKSVKKRLHFGPKCLWDVCFCSTTVQVCKLYMILPVPYWYVDLGFSMCHAQRSFFFFFLIRSMLLYVHRDGHWVRDSHRKAYTQAWQLWSLLQ